MFSPFSLPRVSEDARLRLRLVCLKLEDQEKERCRIQSKLAIRKMELDMENRRIVRDSSRKRGEAAVSSAQPLSPTRSIPSDHSTPTKGFDVSRNIVLVPQFREAEVDAFERVATSLKWPEEVGLWLLWSFCGNLYRFIW